jgi:nucleoside-diphosphate-sugar epimerase
MSTTPAIVIGAGPVGTTVALQLADSGRPVRLLTRSGSGPEHPLIERRRADASQPTDLRAAFDGARMVFDCMHASAYDATVWRAELPPAEAAVLAAAGAVGAVVVFPESLYSHGRVGSPITQDTPRNASSGKPGVRTDLLRARDASSTPTVSVAASDFFGPFVRTSHAGERVLSAVESGKRLQVIGSPDQPHSWTYVPDLAAAMIRAADDEALWDSFLHAPTGGPVSQRGLAQLYADALGAPTPKVSGLPAGLLNAVGVVHRGTRELAEMAHQFTAPFVLDSSASEALLGLTPTPMTEAVAATVAWWRSGE